MFIANRSRRGLLGIVVACAALLTVSCGSDDQSPAGAHSSGQTAVDAGTDVVLLDLDAADEVAKWTTVNDPVMGGRSTSRVAFGNGGLVFSGDVSLANNGGFASARSAQDPDIGQRATGATALRVSAVGDGKIYLVKVGTPGQPWSYVQRFATEAGVQRTYDLPVEGFRPVGMRLDPAPDAPQTLDPSSISQVGVYILDEQQGPFQITVNSIAVRT